MMLEKMTMRELTETMVYAGIEPIGEMRHEVRHGQLMHLLDKAHFKRKDKVTPVDFMNFIEAPPKKTVKLSPEEMQAKVDREIFGL